MDWTRGHTLGRGSTAAVYIAECRRSGEVFAVKSAELHRSEELQKEQGILSTLNCPQIVTYQGYDVTYENGAHWYNLFMEYAPRGTLVDLVSDHNGAMEEAMVGFYTRQILLGLNYLHSNGIVHCDVKGQNVLVTDQGAKIADLGCARRVGSGGQVIAGTPAFMAPEVARGEQQGFPADVWALGCTVLEMITGKPPWHGLAGDPVSVLYRVGFSGGAPEVPGFVSEQGKDFLSRCLRRDPSDRWTVEELLGHAFVAESRLEKSKEFAFGRCDSDTPTSVLERGFWDSLRTTRDSPRGCCSLDSTSPGERVRRLCGTGEPVWDWDDDDDDEKWITVRSNEMSEKEFLWFPSGEGSIEETEDCGSDSVGILREENGLVIFYEPKAVVANAIQLSRWNEAVDDDCYLCSINCGCCKRDSILFLGCSCLETDYQKKEIFITRGFLLSLLPAFNFTLDELKTLQFKIEKFFYSLGANNFSCSNLFFVCYINKY